MVATGAAAGLEESAGAMAAVAAIRAVGWAAGLVPELP